ncbi:MAG TPA: DoxX family protein [Myxococcota bacterium]|nr:DoxX family protein [Myxococcota bacterium]
MGFLAPYAEHVYALFRIMMGLLMLQHGTQKLLGWFGGVPEGAPAFIVYGSGTIELVGALLVAIGLFAAPAAFIVSGTMAVAFFMGHVLNPDQNPTGSIVPVVNGGELAVAYCFAYLFIAAKGSGIWSVDAARGAK